MVVTSEALGTCMQRTWPGLLPGNTSDNSQTHDVLITIATTLPSRCTWLPVFTCVDHNSHCTTEPLYVAACVHVC